MLALRKSTILYSVGVLFLALTAQLATAQDWDPTPKGNIDAGGDKTRRPIVFVHGIRGAGEQFERPSMLFASNGYPASWIVAFDWDGSGGGGARGAGGAEGERGARGGRGARGAGAAPGAAAPAGSTPAPAAARGGAGGADRGVAQGPTLALDKFIDEVRARTGHDKIDLVGHSAGTAQSKAYLSDPKRAAKVAHFGHLAGGAAANEGGVPTLVVGSNGDRAFGEGGARDGAKHFVVRDQDHVKVCTSTETFEQVYTFFNDGKAPKTLKIEPQDEIQVAGYVKTSGKNVPIPTAKVAVYEVAAETGKRLKEKPLVTLSVAEDGQWGPFRAKPGQHYEFVVTEPTIERERHFYREPFTRSDRLVYFRIASKAANSSPSPLDAEPKYLSDKSSIYSLRHLNGGITQNKDSLKINGTEVSTEEVLGGASTTVVVLYALDGNENGKSDFTKVTGPAWSGALTFTGAVDTFVPADPNGHVKFEFNGRTLNVPALKSSEAGSVNVIFN